MSRVVIGAMLLAFTMGHAGAQEAVDMGVHSFYYSWYRNLETDGAWSHWNHHIILQNGVGDSFEPPDDIGANFYPGHGLYSSMSPDDVDTHMKDHVQAGVGVVSVTWWGVDHPTNESLPVVFDAAERHGLKVNFHVEPFQGRNAATTREAIEYLLEAYGDHPALYRYEGRPMIYLYDSYLTSAEDWARLLQPDGEITIRNTPHDCVVLGLWVGENDGEFMVEGGFDGFYTYFATDGFTYGSTIANWPTIAAFADEHELMYVPSVGPGYDDTRIRPWNAVNQRDREGGAYYDRMFEAAIALDPPIISITSYNEWHEGTQIAPAVPKSIPGYAYEDYGDLEPNWYLDRTRYWIEQWRGSEHE